MPRCTADKSIERKIINGFAFPLGVYPVEEMSPKAGYTIQFEAADGGGDADDDEWEEWPDRYVFDVVISATRVEALCKALFSLLPGRVYPIMDVLGRDAFREVDPYITYDLVGTDRFLNACRWLRDFLFEDGLIGFGAMSEEPFFYIFIDEHKIVTIRCEPKLKERVEKTLAAFDLLAIPEPAGADAASHEHRGALLAPPAEPDLLDGDQVLEFLRDDWNLVLNIDPETNLDDEGKDLGSTPWRCMLRGENDNETRYAVVIVSAPCYREAEDLAIGKLAEMCDKAEIDFEEAIVLTADRLTKEDLIAQIEKLTGSKPKSTKTLPEKQVLAAGWVGGL